MPKQGEIALRPAWPEDTVFRRLVLDVESDSCEHCGATLPSSNLHWWSAPESKSGALLDGVFPPSPHKWPNQPWTAPEVPGGHVDSKLLAGCYLWFKRALAARTDSGCELNWPRMVSDGAGQSNLCPQLCPVVGTGPKMEKKASRNWLLRLALRMSGRLDSNQRPPEPHFPGQECFQPPNVANASLLETYRFHSSHTLRRSQPKINEFPTFSRLFRAQACPGIM